MEDQDRKNYDEAIKLNNRYIKWLEEVQRRYEARLQEQANRIRRFEATAVARAEGREPTGAELNSFRHIETERYIDAE
mgnify:FL=1